MKGKAIKYVLKNNYKPAAWQLPMSNEFQDREGNGLRKIVYIKGGKSKWAEDYPNLKELTKEDHWFERGSLFVDETDALLRDIIDNHTRYGVDFIMDDPEAEAKIRLRKFKAKERVNTELAGLKDYSALADALSYRYEVTANWSDAEKELKCYEEAEKDPERVLKAMENPMTNVKYLVSLALTKGIIAVNGNRTAVIWTRNGDEIVPLPAGKLAQDVLPEFLFAPKGEATFNAIAKMVDGGKAPTDTPEPLKAKTAKRPAKKN